MTPGERRNPEVINGSRRQRIARGSGTSVQDVNRLLKQFAQLRKIIKTRGQFPTDEAATKLIWLALRNITAKWERTSHYWRAAMAQFAILYEDRFLARPT